MSFGFSVGDFLGASQLAWNLYRYCYVVAKGAPEDFRSLLQEITALSQSLRLLEEDAKNPESTLMKSGEARIVMVREMIVRVMVTLKELEKFAKKYEKLGEPKQGQKLSKQVWKKFMWSVEASSLDSLRNKVGRSNTPGCESWC